MSFDLKTGKVLIIDDDARNIFALSAVLKARGYQCISAQSGQEGLEKLRNNGKDTAVVLMDMMMPEMDGYEAMKRIREEELSSAPIIALTAQAMAGDRERCLRAGAADYISKPVDVDKLIGVLNNYIR